MGEAALVPGSGWLQSRLHRCRLNMVTVGQSTEEQLSESVTESGTINADMRQQLSLHLRATGKTELVPFTD